MLTLLDEILAKYGEPPKRIRGGGGGESKDKKSSKESKHEILSESTTTQQSSTEIKRSSIEESTTGAGTSNPLSDDLFNPRGDQEAPRQSTVTESSGVNPLTRTQSSTAISERESIVTESVSGVDTTVTTTTTNNNNNNNITNTNAEKERLVQEPLDQNDTTTSQLEDMMNTFDEPQQQI
jgi:hypothetical protein